MAVRLPVDPYKGAPPAPILPAPAPGTPTPSTTTTSGSGESPGSPGNSSSFAGASTGVIDYYKLKASNLLNPALTSHYRCKFSPTTANGALLKFLKQGEGLFPGSDYSNSFNSELIELSCSEASLPGSSLMTNEINDDHSGVTERHVYRRQYDDRIDFTFYVDGNYKIINFFERWISYCAGENDQTNLTTRNFSYRANFPDDYQVDELYVTKFERNRSGSVLQYKFIRAYPISMTSIPVSYDSSQLLKCTVSFSYTRYVRNVIQIEKTQEPQQQTATGVPDPIQNFINNTDPVTGEYKSNPNNRTESQRLIDQYTRPEPLWPGPESGTPQPSQGEPPLW